LRSSGKSAPRGQASGSWSAPPRYRPTRSRWAGDPRAAAQ
jgi:hypothetical protein